MSPLCPLTIEAAKGKIDERATSNLLITTGLGLSFHYSMSQLYDLRHEENILPSISNRSVFDAIRRPEGNVNTNYRNNMFHSNGNSSGLNRLGGRSNRSIFRPPTLLGSNVESPQSSNQRNGNNFQNQINFNRGE